jgi:hypothetical protein
LSKCIWSRTYRERAEHELRHDDEDKMTETSKTLKPLSKARRDLKSSNDRPSLGASAHRVYQKPSRTSKKEVAHRAVDGGSQGMTPVRSTPMTSLTFVRSTPMTSLTFVRSTPMTSLTCSGNCCPGVKRRVGGNSCDCHGGAERRIRRRKAALLYRGVSTSVCLRSAFQSFCSLYNLNESIFGTPPLYVEPCWTSSFQNYLP